MRIKLDTKKDAEEKAGQERKGLKDSMEEDIVFDTRLK